MKTFLTCFRCMETQNLYAGPEIIAFSWGEAEWKVRRLCFGGYIVGEKVEI